MSAFLFWNLNGKDIAEHVAELALERLADFVIVAECESPASLLKSLNEKFPKQEGALARKGERIVQKEYTKCSAIPCGGFSANARPMGQRAVVPRGSPDEKGIGFGCGAGLVRYCRIRWGC
jgi:hypothetical protein